MALNANEVLAKLGIQRGSGMNPATEKAKADNTTMSAQEVQNVVNSNAQTAAGLPTTGLQVNGMGRTGSGAWRNLVGPANAVTDYSAFLQAAPGAYQSAYQPAMQATMNQLLNPSGFRYEVNADGLYQQIKDNYIRQGRQAMMDTQGQSAALTGGYGNSYGVMAGQQAYQESLGNLAGIIPELQQLAYQQYRQGEDDKRNNLEAMNKLEAQDYARWLDDQEAYAQMLAQMPAAQRAAIAGGGGYSGPKVINPTAGSGQFVVDPNMQMALADYVKAGYGTVDQMYSLAKNGNTLKGVPIEQLNYFVNQQQGRATGDPSRLGYLFSNPSGVMATPYSNKNNGSASAGTAAAAGNKKANGGSAVLNANQSEYNTWLQQLQNQKQ